MSKLGRLLVSTALVSLAAAGTASAGGFQRGTADTDVLFETGTVTFRSGLTYVNPDRGFTSINGAAGDYSRYTGTYNIPSIALGFGGDLFACAATYTESFAAEADYTGSPGGALPSQNAASLSVDTASRRNLASGITSRTRTIGFDSDEFGATCRASYQADMGRFSLLGGVFFEDFDFQGSSFGERSLNASLGPVGAALTAQGASVILPTQVDVRSRGDYKTGFRLGAAYEMQEIALRVQGIYRSEVEHDDVAGGGTLSVTNTAFVRLANGTTVSVPTFFGTLPGLNPIQRATIIGQLNAISGLPGAGLASALNTATSPQSFTINAQTGIAEGTLLLGSFRWTDWSTNQTVVSSVTGSFAGQAVASSSYSPYYWRDGYTASLGIGRAFTENVSGAISVGYDRGVSTGADTTYTDLYTLSGGFSVKDNKFGELRLGGLIGYWTDGSQSVSENSYYNATVDEDWVYGANASLKFSF